VCPADGRFRGWVAPAVCERYRIAGDPDAAWEAGGGGKFSFKIDKKGGWVAWGWPGVGGCRAAGLHEYAGRFNTSQLPTAAAHILHHSHPTHPLAPPTHPHSHPRAAIPSNLKGRGWSDARAFSHTQLQKNPNAYFYRHVVPHEQQVMGRQPGRRWVACLGACRVWRGEQGNGILCFPAVTLPQQQSLAVSCCLPSSLACLPCPLQAQGEWTEEEHEAFVATAREHGVGDKWGLFASYLPQRVGYQCSAYYRCGSSKGAGQTAWCTVLSAQLASECIGLRNTCPPYAAQIVLGAACCLWVLSAGR
jgi:hypothetical protein